MVIVQVLIILTCSVIDKDKYPWYDVATQATL